MTILPLIPILPCVTRPGLPGSRYFCCVQINYLLFRDPLGEIIVTIPHQLILFCTSYKCQDKNIVIPSSTYVVKNETEILRIRLG